VPLPPDSIGSRAFLPQPACLLCRSVGRRQTTAALSAGKYRAPGYQRSIFCAFVRLPLSASPGGAARDTCGSAAAAVRPDGRPGTKPQAGQREARNAGPQCVPACGLAGVQPRAGRAPHIHKVHDQPHLLHLVRHRRAATVRQGTLPASPAAHPWPCVRCLPQQGSAAECPRVAQFDALRTARFAAFGFLVHAPTGHVWYNILDNYVYPSEPTRCHPRHHD
jgi:hypothetical protein